jgi:hypothetical protein
LLLLAAITALRLLLTLIIALGLAAIAAAVIVAALVAAVVVVGATLIAAIVVEGTTFSQYVLAERLACARRVLLDPRHAHQSIGAIAYASGFGDLSHFNHAFRRRYGATPSEVRREQSE